MHGSICGDRASAISGSSHSVNTYRAALVHGLADALEFYLHFPKIGVAVTALRVSTEQKTQRCGTTIG
jgi:hypothetical protein